MIIMCVAVVLFIIIIFLSTFISHTKFAYAIRIAAIASEKRMNHNKKKNAASTTNANRLQHVDMYRY